VPLRCGGRLLARPADIGQQAAGGEVTQRDADAVGGIGERHAGVGRRRELQLLPAWAADVRRWWLDRQRRGDVPVLAGVECPGRADGAVDGGLVRGARVGAALVDAHPGGRALPGERVIDVLVGAEPGFFEAGGQRPVGVHARAGADEVRVLGERRASGQDESGEHHRQREDEQYASSHAQFPQ